MREGSPEETGLPLHGSRIRQGTFCLCWKQRSTNNDSFAEPRLTSGASASVFQSHPDSCRTMTAVTVHTGSPEFRVIFLRNLSDLLSCELLRRHTRRITGLPEKTIQTSG